MGAFAGKSIFRWTTTWTATSLNNSLRIFPARFGVAHGLMKTMCDTPRGGRRMTLRIALLLEGYGLRSGRIWTWTRKKRRGQLAGRVSSSSDVRALGVLVDTGDHVTKSAWSSPVIQNV